MITPTCSAVRACDPDRIHEKIVNHPVRSWSIIVSSRNDYISYCGVEVSNRPCRD